MDDEKVSPWIRWLRRAPTWVLALVVAVLYTVVTFGTDLLQGKALTAGGLAAKLLVGVLFGGFVAWFRKRQRAKERQMPAGSPTRARLQSAVSTGRIPDEALEEEWIPELTQLASNDRGMVWFGPIMGGALATVCVVVIFFNPAYPWAWVLSAIGFAGLGIWCPIWVLRRRTLIARLIMKFQNREGTAS